MKSGQFSRCLTKDSPLSETFFWITLTDTVKWTLLHNHDLEEGVSGCNECVKVDLNQLPINYTSVTSSPIFGRGGSRLSKPNKVSNSLCHARVPYIPTIIEKNTITTIYPVFGTTSMCSQKHKLVPTTLFFYSSTKNYIHFFSFFFFKYNNLEGRRRNLAYVVGLVHTWLK
jgi:hypothetical protein